MSLERINKKDDRRKPNTPLRLALAAVMALGSASPIVAESSESATAIGRESVEDIQDISWFQKILAQEQLPESDWLRMEDVVMNEKVPLPEQLMFLKATFAENGPYKNAFNDPHLTEEQLSKMLEVVSRVSARMNNAYTNGRPIQGYEYLFSHLDVIRNSVHTMGFKGRDGQPHFGNGFLYRSAEDKVRFDTNKHVVAVMPAAMASAYTVSDVSDAASRRVSPSEYERMRITSSTPLPVLDPQLTENDIVGRPVISYSWSPALQQKTHFSIAMPWTKSARELTHGKNVDTTMPDLKTMMFMLKPPEEGRVTEFDAQGKPIVWGAGGSSGSLVALPSQEKVNVVGSFMGVTLLTDTCGNLCYAMSSFNVPATHAALAIPRRRK